MKFVNSLSLNNHVYSTHKDSIDTLLPYRCVDCEDDKRFMTEGQLKNHKYGFHRRRKPNRFDRTLGPFICETCGATYPTKYNLGNHRKSNVTCQRLRGEIPEKGEGESVICEICGGGFASRLSMRRHVKVVHEKKFTMRCEICGQGKNGQFRLDVHLWQKHRVGEEARWICGVEGCKYQLFGKRDREDHMKRHNGEVPSYKCDECGKGFYMYVNLRQHVREVHEGKRVKNRGKKRDDDAGVFSST